MNVGDCLRIDFRNLLNPTPVDDQQPATRTASVHVTGMQLVGSIASDGSFAGQNASSIVAPNQSAVYTLYAEREGGYLLYSTAAQTGGEGNGGSINSGLFGAVVVEPAGVEWYRSQITAEEREYATVDITSASQPFLDFDAVYPPAHPRAGVPILKMLHGSQIIHSDLFAIITGPNQGRISAGTYPARRRRAGPPPALPRVRDHLPRRDRRGAGVPAVPGRGRAGQPRAARRRDRQRDADPRRRAAADDPDAAAARREHGHRRRRARARARRSRSSSARTAGIASSTSW